jgi:hypothetical protein
MSHGLIGGRASIVLRIGIPSRVAFGMLSAAGLHQLSRRAIHRVIMARNSA